jgi:hypothetical protein
MAGFEVIVRPVVFPNIRPQPSRSLPPASDDPKQGQAVLSGSNGQVIALTHSYSASASSTGGTETERTFDVARITPSDSGGGVSRSSGRATGTADTFVDVEVVKKVKMRDKSGNTSVWNYTPIEEADNIEIIQRDQTRKTS